MAGGVEQVATLHLSFSLIMGCVRVHVSVYVCVDVHVTQALLLYS